MHELHQQCCSKKTVNVRHDGKNCRVNELLLSEPLRRVTYEVLELLLVSLIFLIAVVVEDPGRLSRP